MSTIANHQPYLNRAVAGVRAPLFALGGDDGQIRAGGVEGIYMSDRRVASVLLVRLDGVEPTSVSTRFVGADTMHNESIALDLGDTGPDPTVLLHRRRGLDDAAAYDEIVLRSYARSSVSTSLEIEVGCDLAEVAAVKGGDTFPPLVAVADGATLRWRHADGTETVATADPLPDSVDPVTGRFGWDVDLAPGDAVTVRVTITVSDDPTPLVVLPAADRKLAVPEVEGSDPRLGALTRQSVADLSGLLLADPLDPTDRFFAAGMPWYLTLFGRDSILAAHLGLLLGTDVAAGTLRTLARRQGTTTDLDSAEEPGKILHEIRRGPVVHSRGSDASHTPGMSLPPLYYGTVDASALWVLLLHDAWRFGLPGEQVEPLVPHLTAALRWMRDYGTDDRGFQTYLDRSGHGLANQGWKDSHDSVQFADGQLAKGPIALCEVQGYAYAAARRGADLLDAFGAGGTDEWRSWADGLRSRFRAHFWAEDDLGRYPGIALDSDGALVDSVTSNMGHLLATGILDHDEAAAVARRLRHPDLSSGYGLRTLATSSAGFNPLSYHAGSVWTHDTAMAVHGLGVAARAGVDGAAESAGVLIEGLLRAGADFDFRVPELYGGFERTPSSAASAYPASCRPQAWSAASAIAVLQTIVGVDADVPAGVLRIRPLRPNPVGPLTVRGLQVAGGTLDVSVDAAGVPTVHRAPHGLQVLT